MKTVVLDIGGTAMKSGFFDGDQLLCTREHATPADKSSVSMMKAAIAVTRQYDSFDRIGISTTGQVDTRKGHIIYSNGIMEPYTGTEICKVLEETFHVPVKVENDANCAALGEAYFGSGRQFSDFLCLTYGTGIGGGIILNRKLYHGTGFSAGEFGALLTHTDETISGDPWSGSYENHASTTALVRMVSQEFPELTDGKAIFGRAEDPRIRVLIERWIWEISLGLISLIHIFNPEGIVLGGGVMEQEVLLSTIRNHLDSMLMPGFRHVKIVQASLGNHAGLYGAVALFPLSEGESRVYE